MSVHGLSLSVESSTSPTNQQATARFRRVAIAMLLGAATTFGIAWIMRSLIEPEFSVLEEPGVIPRLSYVMLPEETLPPKRVSPPKPPPVAEPPPLVPRVHEGESGGFAELTFDERPSPGPGLRPTLKLADGGVMSLVQARPVYPEAAKRRGMQGYVVVEYSVLANGSVGSTRIVDAQPAEVFDRAALTAVHRSRYRPRVVDGQPVETAGLRTRLTFAPK